MTVKKKITKVGHSPEELKARDEYFREASTCPNCGNPIPIGITYTYYGFFRNRKVDGYSCQKCGCEWEVEPFDKQGDK